MSSGPRCAVRIRAAKGGVARCASGLPFKWGGFSTDDGKHRDYFVWMSRPRCHRTSSGRAFFAQRRVLLCYIARRVSIPVFVRSLALHRVCAQDLRVRQSRSNSCRAPNRASSFVRSAVGEPRSSCAGARTRAVISPLPATRRVQPQHSPSSRGLQCLATRVFGAGRSSRDCPIAAPDLATCRT